MGLVAQDDEATWGLTTTGAALGEALAPLDRWAVGWAAAQQPARAPRDPE